MAQKLRNKNKKQFLDRYEKEAHTYDDVRTESKRGKYVQKTQVELLSHIATRHNAKKLCEAGCGTGRILIPLSEKGFDMHGFDPSKNMLTQLKKKQTHSVTIKKGDIEDIPFEKNTFDMVYTIHVLMHLPSGWKKAFEEMRRVTKNGGVTVIDFQNKYSVAHMLGRMFRPGIKGSKVDSLRSIRKELDGLQYKMYSRFSYPKALFGIPIIGDVFLFLEKYLPLPKRLRQRFYFMVYK